MNRLIITALAAGLALSACGDGNPFEEEDDDSTTTDSTDTTDTGTAISGSRTLPPGTASPSAATGLFRSEPTESDGGNAGDGYATGISYDATNDTFTVDNLAFDASNVYNRGVAVSSLGPYAVYESDAVFIDNSLASSPSVSINQFTYRAIYGVSNSGNTQFSVVRTGSYVNYGFGGFVYQRNNNVNLPSSGQALYSGETAGLRDFDGSGGLDFTTGQIQIQIDFDDFNDTTGQRGDGVAVVIYDRKVFDIDGNDITATVVADINSDSNATLTSIPILNSIIAPGILDDNGEMVGELFSQFVDSSGNVVDFETGNYYAIVSGDNAEEIVGVFVVEGTQGQATGVTARETGGFIAER